MIYEYPPCKLCGKDYYIHFNKSEVFGGSVLACEGFCAGYTSGIK